MSVCIKQCSMSFHHWEASRVRQGGPLTPLAGKQDNIKSATLVVHIYLTTFFASSLPCPPILPSSWSVRTDKLSTLHLTPGHVTTGTEDQCSARGTCKVKSLAVIRDATSPVVGTLLLLRRYQGKLQPMPLKAPITHVFDACS